MSEACPKCGSRAIADDTWKCGSWRYDDTKQGGDTGIEQSAVCMLNAKDKEITRLREALEKAKNHRCDVRDYPAEVRQIIDAALDTNS